ncbi:MAG TPA: molecular chaperone TorD family protein [Thermoanaerobaculia bacterium]|nr:molecular chaperone TorD family protein [Thermoanaerobaculia bacterium]
MSREAVAALGVLLAYPRRERFAADLARAEGRLLEAGAAEASEALEAFERAAVRRSFDELEELYTRTFDLSPACAPFLSVHLFGQESFRRARLMTGLEEAYRKAGFDRGTELPDHVAIVLQAAEAFPEAEWAELVERVLARPLAKMKGSLDARNPYRHLVEAVRQVLGVAEVPEEAPAEPHWRRNAASKPSPHPDPLPSREGRGHHRPVLTDEPSKERGTP